VQFEMLALGVLCTVRSIWISKNGARATEMVDTR
jgi:hypothetical protein